jgi:hypothetical protein
VTKNQYVRTDSGAYDRTADGNALKNAPAMRSDIILEDLMPIRIRNRDKNSGSPQHVDRAMVTGDATSVSRAYYAPL